MRKLCMLYTSSDRRFHGIDCLALKSNYSQRFAAQTLKFGMRKRSNEMPNPIGQHSPAWDSFSAILEQLTKLLFPFHYSIGTLEIFSGSVGYVIVCASAYQQLGVFIKQLGVFS